MFIDMHTTAQTEWEFGWTDGLREVLIWDKNKYTYFSPKARIHRNGGRIAPVCLGFSGASKPAGVASRAILVGSEAYIKMLLHPCYMTRTLPPWWAHRTDSLTALPAPTSPWWTQSWEHVVRDARPDPYFMPRKTAVYILNIAFAWSESEQLLRHYGINYTVKDLVYDVCESESE
jgi:hypothetical protein